MGMFTRIVHPVDGRELQIKTGDDDLETYSVGDKVAWHFDPRYPGAGTLLDGAYDSCSSKGEDDWVLIRDHHVLCVVPLTKGLTYTGLESEYDIEPFRREWWTEAQWIARDLKNAQSELKRVLEEIAFLGTCVGKSDEEIKVLKEKHFIEAFTNPIKEILGYEGLARQIFKPIVKEELSFVNKPADSRGRKEAKK